MIAFVFRHRLPCLALACSVTIALLMGSVEHTEARSAYQPTLCNEYIFRELHEERDVYREVQFGNTYPSVADTKGVLTSGLVEYWVTNYQGLECRLHSFCDDLARTVLPNAPGVSLPNQPLGCSRLSVARGRWWSDDRRTKTFTEDTMDVCSFSDLDDSHPEVAYSDVTQLVSSCLQAVDDILEEEEVMLKMVAAQDAAYRSVAPVSGVFQITLRDIYDSFLSSLRGIVDFFGSAIHPLPCILTQCN